MRINVEVVFYEKAIYIIKRGICLFRVTYWQVCKTYGVPPSEIWQACMTTITWAPKITSASMCTYGHRNPPLCSYGGHQEVCLHIKNAIGEI